MKRVFAVLVCLFLATGLSWADRASKKPYQFTQPDGSIITLVNHGDEFHHWTTHNGRLVEQDERGFYRPASRMVFDSQEAAGKERRRQVNEARRAAAGSGIAFGEKHFLVLLIEFDDISFSIPDPRAAFDRMLNQPGYSENGGTGSVRDYYVDNLRWKEGYSAGDTFTFRLLEAKDAAIQSTEWLYDGTKTTNSSVKLSAGKHVITARIHYCDGSQEELTLELNVR